jgi:hypothetical protein
MSTGWQWRGIEDKGIVVENGRYLDCVKMVN